MQSVCNFDVLILEHARKKHVDALETLPMFRHGIMSWRVFHSYSKNRVCSEDVRNEVRGESRGLSFSRRPQRLLDTLARCKIAYIIAL